MAPPAQLMVVWTLLLMVIPVVTGMGVTRPFGWCQLVVVPLVGEDGVATGTCGPGPFKENGGECSVCRPIL